MHPDVLPVGAGPAGPAPPRRAASIRRTSTIDATWPSGRSGPTRMRGAARDAATRRAGDPPLVVDSATMEVEIRDRTIAALTTTPWSAGVDELVGSRGGDRLRAALARAVPHEIAAGSPLHLLLDDLSGTTLVAPIAFLHDDEPGLGGGTRHGSPELAARMEGVCIGFAPGASAIAEMSTGSMFQRVRVVPPLRADDDSDGWHDLTELPEPSFRRARRIDVWRDEDDGTVRVDAGFQDSAAGPDGHRTAVHEYGLRATVDPDGLVLRSVEPDPRVLPWRSCPGAVDTASVLVGTPVAMLRAVVPERLATTRGCTHLNDALRGLAEIPQLLARLDDASSPGSRS